MQAASPDKKTQPRRLHPFLAGLALLLALQCPALWAYRSAQATVLGKYSGKYALFLLGHLILLAAIAAVACSSRRQSLLQLQKTRAFIARALRSRPLLAITLFAPWIGLGAAAIILARGAFGHSWLLHATIAAMALWSSVWLIWRIRPTPRARTQTVAKYGLILASATALLVLFEAAMRANPGLLSPKLILSLPEKGDVFFDHFQYDDEITVGYRYQPGMAFSQELRLSHTYQYESYGGLVPALPEASDQVLSKASFITDSSGYRNQEPLLADYVVVVSGDSFTSHAVEPDPWPSRLARQLNVPILNLGLQGYGPQNQVEAILRFGISKNPRYIIIGYYEGNDLLDAEGYHRRKTSGKGWRSSSKSKLPILDRNISTHLIRHLCASIPGKNTDKDAPEAPAYPYPFTVSLGERDVELAFTSTYLSLLSLSRDDLLRTQGLAVTLQAYARLKSAATAIGARLLIAYFPTKEHCYIPHLSPLLVQQKLGRALMPQVSSTGEIDLSPAKPQRLEVDALLQHLDTQRQTLLEEIARLDIETIDLTPALQAAALDGAQLYWSLDNHWTPVGQALVAKCIGDRLGGSD